MKAICIIYPTILFLLAPFIAFNQTSHKPVKFFPTELTVGDKVPDIYLGKIVNYKKEKVKFSDFRGKYLILDFWATWCAPCVKFITTADSLKKGFGEKIEIIPVTYENATKVRKFLSDMQKSTKSATVYPSVTEDTILSVLFPHTIVPHEVWINPDGVVVNITSHKEVNRNNIEALINGRNSELEQKKDTKKASYSHFLPVLTGKQNILVKSNELLYNSIITKYKPELIGGSYRNGNFLSVINYPLRDLFKYAFSKGRIELLIPDNRLLLEVADSSRFERIDSNGDYCFDNFFCYEANFGKDSISTEQMFTVMQQDLNKYFGLYGIKGGLEKRKVKCWTLVSVGSNEELKSKATTPFADVNRYNLSLANVPIGEFINSLIKYQQLNPIPMIEATGINYNVDMTLKCDLSDISAINSELIKYGLKFVLKKTYLDMIVIIQEN